MPICFLPHNGRSRSEAGRSAKCHFRKWCQARDNGFVLYSIARLTKGDVTLDSTSLLFGYKNEYLAFDFGYQICKYHELAKPGGSARAAALQPPVDYYQIAVHFLKYKTVSPHAIYLLYMSLFLMT